MVLALEKREHQIEQSRRALREKDRMLATLMSNLDGMVYRCRNDDAWTMQFVSDGCFDLTGYRPDELLHNRLISFEDIKHPEDRQRVREEIEAALSEKRRFFIEYRIQCRNGDVKWVWERGVGIYGKRDAAVTLEGFIENVTERKLSTQALQQAERSFRSIFENATEGIFQTSPDGRFLNVNPALARIYGFATPAELIASVGDIQHQIYTDPTRRTEFMSLADIRMMHIPYKGSAPATTDLIAGQVSVGFPGIALVLPHTKAGRLRALAVTSAERFKAMPDVPSIAEAGVPGYAATLWLGLLAPKGTPPEIVQKLYDEIAKVLRQPEVESAYLATGTDVTISNPEQFGRFVKAEYDKWAKVIKAVDAQVN